MADKITTRQAYGEILPDSQDVLSFRDYDGSKRIVMASRSPSTGFTIYVVADIWRIYSRIVLFSLISVVTFLAAIIMVFRVLGRMIRSQDENARQMKEAMDYFANQILTDKLITFLLENNEIK